MEAEETQEEAVIIPDQPTKPGPVTSGMHPLIPYGEVAYKVTVNGTEYLVKESDMALIDLTPHPKRKWREQGACDYHVACHRGWVYTKNDKKKLRFIPVNPGNLGFWDCSRNRQISALYSIDINKASIIHRLWKEHKSLVKQWATVDAMEGEQRDLDKWAEKNRKRMHPLIRTWYRMKLAADALERAVADDSSVNSASKYATSIKQLADLALKIEQEIHRTGQYLDGVLERRVKEKKQEKADNIQEADAQVIPEDMSVDDVNAEIAKIRNSIGEGDA